jgi:cobalt-zinc-cadmium efflux system membrane fusion protein
MVLLVGLVSLAFRSSRAAAPALAMPASDVPSIEGDRIRFSPHFAERAGIRVEPVQVENLVPVISAVGTTELNAEHVAAVGARMRGLVSVVKKLEGDTVSAGEVLAKVESPELGEAQAAVGMLNAQREVARLNAEREAKLAERSLTTAREAEVAAVEAQKASWLLSAARQKVTALGGASAAKSSLGIRDLRSPLTGTIVERNVLAGQFVSGDVVVFKVANLDYVWIELDVFERNLARVHAGDPAEVQPLVGNAKVLRARVARVSPRIDPETHSAKVRIEVDNKDRGLRVGQAIKATIHSSGGELSARPTVAADAVTLVDGKPTVFVVVEPNVVRVTNVTLGASDGHETEVVQGLQTGDQVVTTGAFALKSELFR